MPARTTRLLAWLLALAGAGLALRVAPFQVDDAFITYRYAANFVARGEIAFNPGEAWVEGFTSPLWFLLLSAQAALFGAGLLPLLGMLSGVAAWCAALWLVRRLASGGSGAQLAGSAVLLPFALVALSPDLGFWAVAGMEEILLVAALLLALAAARDVVPFGWGVVAAAAATWVRPEAAALPLLLAVEAIVRDGAPALRSRRLWWLAAATVAGGALLVACRYALFGALLPNTFFAKTPSLAAGLGYLLQSLASPATGALAALGVAGGVVGSNRHRAWAASAVVWLALVVAEGGDWMPHARFLLPALAFFALAAAGLVDRPPGDSGRTRRLAVALAVALALALSVLQSLMTAWRVDRTETRWRAELAPLVSWLDAAGARSIGLVDIGRVGFESQLEIFDFGGLVDPVVAHSPGGLLAKELDLRYLFEVRRPDLLMIRFQRPPRGVRDGVPQFELADAGAPIEARILADPRLLELYRPRLLLLPGWEPDRYQDRYGCRLLFVARGFEPAAAAEALLPPPVPSGVSTVTIADPLRR